MYYWAKCKECLNVVEINIPSWYDGPEVCPDCRACDSVEEIDKEEFDREELEIA